jgi:hypothetical protein
MVKLKICRPWITKNGVRIYAKNVGKKAFCWEVTEEEHKAYLEKKAKEKAKKEKEAAKQHKETTEKSGDENPHKEQMEKPDNEEQIE